VIWNAHHNFETLHHTAANAAWSGRKLFNLDQLGEFLVAQFGAFGPIPFAVLIAGGAIFAWRRRLTQADIDWLATAGALRRGGAGGYQVLPLLRLAVQLREVDMPIEAITEANQAVNKHMAELADELTRILRSRVLTRYEHAGLSADEADELQRTLANLRTLTLEAIVESFQRAANQVARKSLSLE
jgi:hypothetical protein